MDDIYRADTIWARSSVSVQRRQQAILLIKTVHTLIFALVSSCVMHVLAAGLRNRATRWTNWATGIVIAEAAIYAANRQHCPLTTLTEQLGAAHGQVTDIFLPRWFADHIPQIYTPLFVIGLSGRWWHQYRQPARRTPSATSASAAPSGLASCSRTDEIVTNP